MQFYEKLFLGGNINSAKLLYLIISAFTASLDLFEQQYIGWIYKDNLQHAI